jgi:hypothetical protein
MAAFVSSEVDGGNRWKAPAPEPAMVDIVVQGTAAEDNAEDTATPDTAAAKAIECTVVCADEYNDAPYGRYWVK